MEKVPYDFKGLPVAVYGSLRAGHGNNRLLVDSELLSTERVKGMGMVSLGGFPAAYPSEEKEITIEVYKPKNIDTERSLDYLEGFPTFYDRKIISTSVGDAWIYFIGNYNEKSPNQVESGDWNEAKRVFNIY